MGRPGVTLLEVMVALALLAGTVATVTAGYGSLMHLSTMQQDRLNAMEVAHRLVLIYTHQGPKHLPDENEPIRQIGRDYRYRLGEYILIEEPAGRDGLTVRNAKLAGSLTPNKRLEAGLVMITVNVYPADSDDEEPAASLSRIFWPYDTTQSDDALLEHVLHLLGEGFGAPTSQ